VESAAPRKAGQLESSVRVFEGVDRKALTGSVRRRLLIGPEKRKGFYGYFLDAGWNIRGKRASGTGSMTKAAASVERQAQEAETTASDAVVNRIADEMTQHARRSALLLHRSGHEPLAAVRARCDQRASSGNTCTAENQ